ncbi:hypothetical protein ABZ449_30960, partial [Kitasatospora sp. NPDC005856]
MGTGQNASGGESTGYQLPAVAWLMEEGDEADAAEPAAVTGPGPAASAPRTRFPSAPVGAGAEPVAAGPAGFGAAGFGPATAAGPVSATAAEPGAPEPGAPEPAAGAESAAGRTGALGAARLNALRRAFLQAPARAARGLAPAAPARAVAAAGPEALGPAAAPAAEERTGRLRGLPRPAVAAAAVGVVLMGLPLVLGRGDGGADPVESLGAPGTSRADTTVPDAEVSGTPAETPAETPAGTPSAGADPTTAPVGTPIDPAATGLPVTGPPVPGPPGVQPAVPVPAGGVSLVQPVGSAPVVRSAAGTAPGPAPGGAPQPPA